MNPASCGVFFALKKSAYGVSRRSHILNNLILNDCFFWLMETECDVDHGAVSGSCGSLVVRLRARLTRLGPATSDALIISF
jgi:hypothetical protein